VEGGLFADAAEFFARQPVRRIGRILAGGIDALLTFRTHQPDDGALNFSGDFGFLGHLLAG